MNTNDCNRSDAIINLTTVSAVDDGASSKIIVSIGYDKSILESNECKLNQAESIDKEIDSPVK